MQTNSTFPQKPALHRNIDSDSTLSVASSASREDSRGRVLARPPRETKVSWGYVYGAATFAKSVEQMSGEEKLFAKEVASRLTAPSPLRPEEWNDAPPTRVQTVRAQIEQWRAEDEAREAMKQPSIGGSVR